jgi:two-component system, chemotaxis family, response regulator WspF
MRIGIASALPEVIAGLRQILAQRPGHELLWVAGDGARAADLCAQNRPDLLLMTLGTPGNRCLEAITRIMAETPCAILIVTRHADADSSRVFAAMGCGAIDVVDAPLLSDRSGANMAVFLRKLDTVGTLVSTPRFIPDSEGVGDTTSTLRLKPRLVAIGASAGGPAALGNLLANIPKDFPAAIVIVQHVDKQFAAGMAAWLSHESPLPVRVAAEGDRILPGTILLAATNDHLTLKASDRLGYSRDPPDCVYRPSIDAFFDSICAWWQGEAVGVLLTGMGGDGAKGLKSLRNKGHYTIAQDQATSAVYGMPKAAMALGAAVDILPIGRIGARLIDIFHYKC